MALNGDTSIQMTGDSTVNLMYGPPTDSMDNDPWRNQYQDNNQGRYAKLNQDKEVLDRRETYITRKQAYYILGVTGAILFITFILIIVGAVKINWLQSLIENGNGAALPLGRVADSSTLTPSWHQATTPTYLSTTTKTAVEPRNPDWTPSFHEKVAALDSDFLRMTNCSIAWVDVQVANGLTIKSKVTGGATSFFVVRAKHLDGLIPGEASVYINKASIDYHGDYQIKSEYQALTDPSSCVKWIHPDDEGHDGFPLNAVPGGFQPMTGEMLYICLSEFKGLKYYGWVKADEKVCHFASTEEDATSTEYKLLIAV